MGRKIAAVVTTLLVLAVLAYGYHAQRGAAKQTLASASVASSPAPAIVGTDLDRHRFSLAAYRGKRPIVLNFMQDICKPCRDEAPAFAAFARAVSPKIAVTAIGMASTDAGLRAFAKRFHWGFPIVPVDLQAVDAYRIGGYPVTIIVDRGGNIVYRQAGPVDFAVLRAKVRELA